MRVENGSYQTGSPVYPKALWCLLAAIMLSQLGACASAPRVPVSAYELQPADNVTLAGALSPEALPQMRKNNTVVIDLRTAAEGSAEEQAQMRDAGITYYNIPVGRAGLPAGSAAEFATLLQTHENQPVIVHCRSGNRAGLLWATHLIDEGASNKTALSAVDGIVTSPGIRAAIEGYAPSGKPD